MTQNQRVLSGMRATGNLHLGHYHGVLKNWLQLQYQYECYFFIADLHSLTTHYEKTEIIPDSVWDMVIEWLAVGLNPNACTLFLQSRVPQHAELFLLLSMITPLSWLERVPTYKDQIEKLKEFDLSTYGFLGYPLLQSADILLYKPTWIPVGEDQTPHVEITREIARRFNHIYGAEVDFEDLAEHTIQKLGKKNADLYHKLRIRYQQQGDHEALDIAYALLNEQQNLSIGDKERLEGYLVGSTKIILPEPQVLLTPNSKMPGLDGQKMSKSYKNCIYLNDSLETLAEKIRRMPTDPARIRRSDPGEPTKCPVFSFHQIYSDEATCEWVTQGCRSAGIGCIECKQPVIQSINDEISPIRDKIAELKEKPEYIKSVIYEGNQQAQEVAEETLEEVREAMNLVGHFS